MPSRVLKASRTPIPASVPKSHQLSYHISRGETGVLTFEPYKSALLPYWRFKTVTIAKESSITLYQKFLSYYEERDFPGMDMARKFIQMGMTRAKRYANYKGGRKYVNGKENGRQIKKSTKHQGKEEKEKASLVFKEVLEKCKAHEGYQELKVEFLKEQMEWEAVGKNKKIKLKGEDDGEAKEKYD